MSLAQLSANLAPPSNKPLFLLHFDLLFPNLADLARDAKRQVQKKYSKNNGLKLSALSALIGHVPSAKPAKGGGYPAVRAVLPIGRRQTDFGTSCPNQCTALDTSTLRRAGVAPGDRH